jgi:hypothetical protein
MPKFLLLTIPTQGRIDCNRASSGHEHFNGCSQFRLRVGSIATSQTERARSQKGTHNSDSGSDRLQQREGRLLLHGGRRSQFRLRVGSIATWNGWIPLSRTGFLTIPTQGRIDCNVHDCLIFLPAHNSDSGSDRLQHACDDGDCDQRIPT